MTPDNTAALRQLNEHAAMLAVDLESVRMSPGVNLHEIRVAEFLLKKVVERATWALTSGVT